MSTREGAGHHTGPNENPAAPDGTSHGHHDTGGRLSTVDTRAVGRVASDRCPECGIDPAHERAFWYARGYDAGDDGGYRRAQREVEIDYRRRVADPPRLDGGPSHTELERRRWGPGGRAHFADPRPGDFPGKRCAGGDAA